MPAVSARIGGENVEIADGYQQDWARVIARGNSCIGLQFKFGDADSIFHPEDFLGTAFEDLEGPFLVPFDGGVAEFFILQDFDGDIAEGLVAAIARDVFEVARDEESVSIAQ